MRKEEVFRETVRAKRRVKTGQGEMDRYRQKGEIERVVSM